MNQCLLSAGLDHEAFVWNTYVKDKIFLLRGHNHPLVGVKCLPDTPQIITADTSGMVKVWDVRNFLCVQTFNAPLDELAAFLYESGYLIGNDSGLGHLASALGIPTLTFCRRKTWANMWAPSFHKNIVLTPYSWIPNISGFRLRDKQWKRFISVGRAIRAFNKL